MALGNEISTTLLLRHESSVVANDPKGKRDSAAARVTPRRADAACLIWSGASPISWHLQR